MTGPSVDLEALHPAERVSLAHAHENRREWRHDALLERARPTVHGWHLDRRGGLFRLRADRLNAFLVAVEAYPPLACVEWGWVSLGRHEDPDVDVKALLIEAMPELEALHQALEAYAR